MYPQSELDNYKLQVELLQEKLQRSEENRHQLEHKLDQILQKRSEHDNRVRSKARQRQQQFLEEQQKRNERNRALVQMLERIDEQSAALSARSERLKMMKLQYEMYFAKLVQSQTMRCIQSNAVAANTIPVLLPSTAVHGPATLPAQPAPPPSTAVSNGNGNGNEIVTEATPTSATTTYQLHGSHVGPTTFCLTPRGTGTGTGTVTRDSNGGGLLEPPHWTLAMATPTPGGMMITPSTAAGDFGDYLKYPIGYGYLAPQLHLAYPAHATPIDVLRGRQQAASAAALAMDEILARRPATTGDGSNGSTTVAGQPRATSFEQPNNNNEDDANNYAEAPPPVRAPATAATSSLPMSSVRPLSPSPPTTMTTSTTTSSSTASLTFDKLAARDGRSKTLAAIDAPTSGEGRLAGPSPPRFGGFDDDAVEATKAAARALSNPRDFVNANGSGSGNRRDDANGAAAALATPGTTAATGSEKSLAQNIDAVINDVDDVFGAAASASAASASAGDDNAYPARRQEIDDSWAAPAATPPSLARQPPSTQTPSAPPPPPRPPQPTTTVNSSKGNANGSHSNSFAADERTDRAPGTNTNNNFSESFASDEPEPEPATTTVGGYEPVKFERKEKMSIETIENAFYGELVSPPLAATEAARTATSGLLEELATESPMAESSTESPAPTTGQAVESYAEEAKPMATTSAEEAVAGYDANYASYQQPEGVEQAAAEGGEYGGPEQEGAGYAQDAGYGQDAAYAGEAGDAYGGYQGEQEGQGTAAQGDYGTLDYQTYEGAAEYPGAYDPNSYPGYTYDEATGQYTADDPGQQQLQQYQTESYEGQQQQQQGQAEADAYEDYGAYPQEALEAAPTTATTTPRDDYPEAQAQAQAQAEVPPAKEAAEPEVKTIVPAKPTSILATHSADKTATNDAQHQKKKKRVNFVDSSETDDSSSVKPDGATGVAPAGAGGGGASESESDFDFSSSGGGGGGGGVDK